MKVLDKIFFQPTLQCNLRCHYCYMKDVLEKCTQNDFSHALSAAQQLADKCLSGGYRAKLIVLHGGEATTLPPSVLASVCNILQSISTKDGFQFVQTNGTLLNPEYMDAFDAVINPDIELTFSISLDGAGDMTDCNRGNGTYAKSMTNARMIKDRGYRASLFSVITAGTLERLDDFEAWVSDILAQGFTWGFQFGFPPRHLSDAQQREFAEWLFERGWHRFAKILSPSACSSHGNACNVLRFDAFGDMPMCGCDRVPDRSSNAHWMGLSMNEIIESKAGYFANTAFSESCSYCPLLSVCNSGCPLTRVEGRALECTLRKSIYSLEAKRRGVPIHKVINLYRGC